MVITALLAGSILLVILLSYASLRAVFSILPSKEKQDGTK